MMKRTDPWVPVGHPDYVWRSHSDVQAIWRKYGWTPPSGVDNTPVLKETPPPVWAQVRRVK